MNDRCLKWRERVLRISFRLAARHDDDDDDDDLFLPLFVVFWFSFEIMQLRRVLLVWWSAISSWLWITIALLSFSLRLMLLRKAWTPLSPYLWVKYYHRYSSTLMVLVLNNQWTLIYQTKLNHDIASKKWPMKLDIPNETKPRYYFQEITNEAWYTKPN